MRRPRYLRRALAGAALPVAFVAASAPAQAQAPSPGDSCTVLHATAQDADGKTMWCNPTMTGTHSLVWQYGGPG
ncbi:hypothetical protein ACX9NE_03195 [Mycobacterium sp. ML4]